jgi:hypothetical protein
MKHSIIKNGSKDTTEADEFSQIGRTPIPMMTWTMVEDIDGSIWCSQVDSPFPF